MKIRRTTMAVVAAGALVLTGCTSGTEEPTDTGANGDSPGGDTGDGTGGTAAPGDDADSTTGAQAGGEEYTGKPDLGITETRDDRIYYSVGADEWTGYNARQTNTYTTYNNVINDRIQEGFWYYGTDGTVYPNEDFGSYEKVSDEPLTVEYTISEEATWEDGTPITYDDFLYAWATENPPSLFGEPEEDAEGEAQLIFDNVSNTFGTEVPEGPQGELGGKTFTVEYENPYPDWQLVVTAPFPAHVAAEQSGMTLEELSQAILDGDAETVEQTAEFWNQGWLATDQQLPDPATVPSSGPYSLDPANGAEWVVGQYINLGPNQEYYGPPPATANLTFRFAAPENHVQALANGDLNVIEPQATVDTVEQIRGLGDGFTLLQTDELTWEHLDFNFAEGSIFSEDAGGLAAREAFALCVPRQAIVDNLITPINPEAQVMDLREVFPFQENYQEVLDAAYDGRYDEVNLEEAQAKFAEAGLEEGVDVRIGYSAPNQRRTEEVALIKSSCDQVGFNVIDEGDPNFFLPGGAQDTGDYEVALFAWAGSGQVASGANIYATGRPQNYTEYSNETVDAAWEEIESSVDPQVHLEQTKIIEKELWDTLFGIPLFAHPGVVAHDASINNVIPTSTQSGVSWNAEQWVRD